MGLVWGSRAQRRQFENQLSKLLVEEAVYAVSVRFPILGFGRAVIEQRIKCSRASEIESPRSFRLVLLYVFPLSLQGMDIA